MNIYVGSLSPEVTDQDLRQAFEAYGRVTSATVIKDKFTSQSRGFGFVEMPDNTEAKAAIDGMNGQDMKGKSVVVNEARPRPEGGRGGGGRGGRGGSGGGRGPSGGRGPRRPY